MERWGTIEVDMCHSCTSVLCGVPYFALLPGAKGPDVNQNNNDR